MPQPRSTATAPPPAPPSGGHPVAAAVAALGTTAVTVTPATAALAADAGTAAAGAAVAKRIAEALLRYARRRGASALDYVEEEVGRQFPDRPKSEIAEVVSNEDQLEEAFRRKQQERANTVLRVVLAIPDEAERARELQRYLDREKQYTAMRESAMLTRSIAREEQRIVRERSPAGAYWKLSPLVKEHTLDCLAMGEQFWPWQALSEFAPPLHAGCPCRLIGLDEAVAQGLMHPSQVPDPGDAMHRYQAIRERLRNVEEAWGTVWVGPDDVADDGLSTVEWLDEAAAPAIHDPDGDPDDAPVGWEGLYADDEPEDPDNPTGGWLVPHAKRELALAGLDRPDSDYGGMVADAVMDMVRTHAREGHSGFSSALTLSVLNKLLNGENLTPLTDDPDEWNHVGGPGAQIPDWTEGGKPVYQSQRNSRAFSNDGGKTYTLLDDRTPGGRKRSKTYKSEPKASKRQLTEARDSRKPVAGDRLRDPGRRRHRLRWDKGWVKGGQFKPYRGGVSDRTRHRRRGLLRIGRPQPQVANERARWQFVGGTYTKVPEGRLWQRQIDGVTYTSPPGSTNVYRDGQLISTPTTDLHPDARRRGRARPAIPAAESVPQSKLEAVEKLKADNRSAAAVRIKAALAAGDPSRPPVQIGEGPEAIAALRDAGFRVDAAGGLYGARTNFVHPSGARVGVTLDRGDYSVRGVDWQPGQTAPRAPRRMLHAPPQSWEAFAADALATADDLAKRHGANVLIGDVRVDPKLEDHAGSHEWNGDVTVGREAPKDVDHAAAAAKVGKPLDEFEARGLYSSYRVAAHEIAHAVNPISPSAFEDSAHRNLEEALAEEAAIPLTQEWLGRHNQDAAVAWGNANPTNISVAGSYLPQRGALATLFDQAGISDPAERAQLIDELKYRTPPAERVNHLGLLVHDEDQRRATPDEPANFGSLEEALAHVELTMANSGDETRPRGVMWSEPRTVTFQPKTRQPVVPDATEPSVPAGTDERIDQALAQAGHPSHSPELDRIAELDPGTADAAYVALRGTSDDRRAALWELAQRADAAPEVRDLVQALVGPLEAADHGISTVRPEDVDHFLAGAAWAGRMHYGADRDVATRLLAGKAPEHDPGLKYRLFGTGFYGSSSLASAKGAPRMRGPKGAVVDVAVRLDHPLLLTDDNDGELGDIQARASERFDPGSTDHADYVRAALRAAGYDGVVREFPDGETWAVALEPGHQVAAVEARAVPGLRPFRPTPTTTAQPGPDVATGRAEPSSIAGLDAGAASFGTGSTFTSGDGPTRLALAGANLHRPRDGAAATRLHDTLRALDGYAEGGQDDEQTLGYLATGLPGADQVARHAAARQGVERHRQAREERRSDADSAATEAMRALGYDGVDVRHLDAFPAPSVLYRQHDEPAAAGDHAMDSGVGGAVVGGVAGRWVWIRGTYRHVPHGSAYDEVADGVRFHSPANTTEVYRFGTDDTQRSRGEPMLVPNLSEGGGIEGGFVIAPFVDEGGGRVMVTMPNGLTATFPNADVGTLVARPRWTNHPDVRRPPRGESTRRRRGQTTTTRPRPPAPPPPLPRPLVGGELPQVGMWVISNDTGFEGRVTRIDGDRLYIAGGNGSSVVSNGRNVQSVITPGIAEGATIRAHLSDGQVVDGTVEQTLSDGRAVIQLDNGITFGPIHQSALELVEQPPRRPDGAPLLPSDVDTLVSFAAPSTWLVTTDEMDGAEFVPGARYNASLATPVTANKLPAELVIGPSFFQLDPAARRYAVNQALGYGLWTSIEGDDPALQELSGMWTDGRMSADVDGQRVHLDRYSLPAAVAAGYAKLNADDWRDSTARYPDALRWLALQADRRGYAVPEDRLAWARGQEIGGSNESDPAEAFARELPTDADGARQYLRDSDFVLRSSGRGTELWGLVTDGNVMTIRLQFDGDRLAEATGYTHARPTGDDPLTTLAEQSRGMGAQQAQDLWFTAGWRYVDRTYGPDRAIIMVSPEGDREVRLTPGSGSSSYYQHDVGDALVGPLTPSTENLWVRQMFHEDPTNPHLVGRDARGLEPAMRDWKLTRSREGRVIDAERVTNADDPNRVRVEQARFIVGEDGRITQAGRPNAGDLGIVSGGDTDPEYQRRIEARTAELRRAARERQQRIIELSDRMRVAINDGREPFEGGEDFTEVKAALRRLDRNWGGESNSRGLADGGSSVTFKNRRTGAKLIVRRDAPDEYGRVKVRANSRVTAPRERDLGRTRTTGRLPASREEWNADILGRSDEYAREQRSDSVATTVRFYEREGIDEHSYDHSGVHHFDGRIGIGARALPDLLEAQQTLAGGGQLTADQKSRAYASYKVMQHEINHAVRIGGLHVNDNGERGIEEALTEELAHIDMVAWMHSHGLDDVVAWAHDQASRRTSSGLHDSRIQGSYLRYREHFRGVLERAGMIDDPGLEDTFRQLKYRTPGNERIDFLAQRIADRERDRGTTAEQAAADIRRTMAGDSSTGNGFVASFRPILGRQAQAARAAVLGRRDEGTEADPGIETEFPVGAVYMTVLGQRLRVIGHRNNRVRVVRDTGRELSIDADILRGARRQDAPQGSRRVGDWVQVRPVRGRAFRGRVIAVGEGDQAGQIQVRKIGRGEEVWVEAGRATLVDRQGNPIPDRETQPGPRPEPVRPDTPYAFGPDGRSMLGVGAVYRGTSTGQLGTITAINDRNNATIRRADGSTYTGTSNQFKPIVINNEGDEFEVNSRVLHPRADGSLNGPLTIHAIDYRDPQRPLVQFTAGGDWVEGRTLKPATPTTLATVQGRSGQVNVVAGSRVVLRDGSVGQALGGGLTEWPLGDRTIRFRPDSGSERTIAATEIARVAGERPGAPEGYQADADAAYALAMSHFRRQATAVGKARRLMQPVNAQIASQVEEWWKARGFPMARGRAKVGDRTYGFDKVLAEGYAHIFESREADAAMGAEMRTALTEIAQRAGLPLPDWSDTPARPLRPGDAPPGTMFDEAVLRHTWTGQFGRTGMTSEVTRVTTNGRSASIEGRVLNRNGTAVGTFSRSVGIDPHGDPFVYHAFLSIQRRNQGGGFASAFNRHAESVYRTKGVKYVKVSANIDIGGYTWAATGFDWNVGGNTPEAKQAARAQKSRQMLDAALALGQITQAEHTSVVGRFVEPYHTGPVPEGKIVHAWELAAIGGRAQRGGPQTLGQKILLGRSWSGIKYLVGEERSPFAGSPTQG